MLTKLRTFASLYRELGPRWTIFRLAYAFRLRTGLIRLQIPQHKWSDLAGRVGAAGFDTQGALLNHRRPISRPSDLPPTVPWNKQTAVEEANRILNGEIKFFAHEFVKTGFPPDWHKDYFSNVTLSASEESLPPQSEILRPFGAQNDMIKHWSQIPDDSSTDIKFIWEPNRFAFVYTLVRAYAASHDEKYPEAFWTLIEDWAQHNPPNTGQIGRAHV